MTLTAKIAAMYARVSMDEQVQNFSLDSQIRRMLQYAQVNGFTVPEEYIFREDFSGMRIDRPELTQLRKLVQQQAIQAVIVFSSDRLTRNPVDGDILRRELRQYGVELHYTTRGVIDDTPEAELFSGIEDQFNAY
jgi:site-specific DNA recombinase